MRVQADYELQVHQVEPVPLEVQVDRGAVPPVDTPLQEEQEPEGDVVSRHHPSTLAHGQAEVRRPRKRHKAGMPNGN